MDFSANAWASSTEQSNPPPTQGTNATPSSTNPYMDVINKLTTELETLKAHMNTQTGSSQSNQAQGKGKKSNVKSTTPVAPNASLSSAAKKKTPAQTTPKIAQRATSAPPKFLNQPKTPKPRKPVEAEAVVKPSPKRHPQQMQNGDFPREFLPTKILWGLLKQDAVPSPPELGMLEEFYKRFRQTDVVAGAHLGQSFGRFVWGMRNARGADAESTRS
ncbi:hypothetical protein PGT21_015676 [Puccinia graminis f. sp. tritici]|uniref:Uncharacterized protein n=1 Tax=Puccinia graminis f. sp. tritici TaxID=56615 RepID=A0A5B0Q388_PUCGR|nr:hypothetical protein PGT21_015676 [Puccinia graminis f. sp. tritici]